MLASGPRPNIWYSRRENWKKKKEEEGPRAADNNHAKKAECVTSSSRLGTEKLTANRETLIHRASELAASARTVKFGQLKKSPMILLGLETALLHFAQNSKNQGTLKIQDHKAITNDHAKIGPVTEIKVFDSAGNLVFEVQVPSQQASM